MPVRVRVALVKVSRLVRGAVPAPVLPWPEMLAKARELETARPVKARELETARPVKAMPS